MTDGDLLRAGVLRMVGSVLAKTKPRDLDLVLVIPDALFRRLFGRVATWRAEGESGQWTTVRHSWSRRCVRLSRLLGRRLGTRRAVDLKIIPASLPDYGRR